MVLPENKIQESRERLDFQTPSLHALEEHIEGLSR